jgi:excinuclease ABC subunit A
MIRIQGAREHNLQSVDVEIGDGLTVVTGVSGSGKTSLVFDTLYHESRRRFLDVYELGSPKGRLAPANVEAITGLGPAVAVGQNLLNRNPSSTLATASGLHPFLRLLYAHFGERTCPKCGTSLSVCTEDEIIGHLTDLARQTPVILSAPLLRGVKGSHRTLLEALAERFGMQQVWVDGAPWGGQTLAGGNAHDIEILLADSTLPNSLFQSREIVRQAAALGAQALIVRRPRQPGDFLHVLCRAPVCPACGTWFGDIRPVDFHRACPHCEGKGCPECAHTGLPPQAAAVRWAGLSFLECLHLTVDEALEYFVASFSSEAGERLPAAASFTPRLRDEISRRLEALQRVGLGYIALDRPSPTLSRGEAQRVRLALTLISRLEDMLHVLDEPTVGQHPADVQRLLPAFRELAGPVVFVEHERAAAAGADQAIDIGPGAGHQGGKVVFHGDPAGLWQADTATGRYFSLRERVQPPEKRPAPTEFIHIRRASLRNLQNIDVPVPIGRLTVITGVSGSGKSTLVEDVFVASLASGSPAGCECIERVAESDRLLSAQALPKPVLVDQSPIGRNPRSNPATYTKLADIIRDLFAKETGLSPSHFSFNRPVGACPTCEGLGSIEVTMRYLPSTWIPCADCEGQRFTDEVLAVKLAPLSKQGEGGREWGWNIAQFYELSISEVREILEHETRLPIQKLHAARRILDALCDIGLGYLSLGQPSPTLSGGEAQRVKLAKYLGKKSLEQELLVLDEPSTGLHPQDLAGLLAVLDRLSRAGATIVIVEHNMDVIRAADWVVDLGPGAGPKGGQLLYAGPVEGLLAVDSPTGNALRQEDSLVPSSPESSFARSLSPHIGEGEPAQKGAIAIRSASVHNLQNVSVDIPKGALTVVTGLSGSGKSSLVHDVLEAEARRRFLETLSLYERQGTREGPEAEVESVSGLGVALTVGTERLVYSRRATAGTATEISHYLAVLLAAMGERKCLECGAPMQRSLDGWECSCGSRAPLAAARHFSSSTYAAACQKCNGVGTLQVPNPAKLIIHPELPLVEGAMYSPGFFPNGYLGKPFNGGYYHVLALAEYYGFDPHHTPWNEMSAEAQQAFLFGSSEKLTVHYHSRTGRSATHQAKFPGFYGFIRDWDVGGTYTDARPCPACGGTRLRPEYLAVTLGGFNVHELSCMTLHELSQVMETLPLRSLKPGAQGQIPLSPGPFPLKGEGENGGNLDVLGCNTSQHIQISEFSLPYTPEERGIRGALETIRKRLRFLIAVGLGYLSLDRVAGTLSAGEAQRIRLASLLGSGLTSLTLLLDEPTRGLHPCEVDALIGALDGLRREGNTVIVVEHDPQVMRAADWVIDMGPGAGRLGGRVVAQGTPAEVTQADTLTGKWLRAPLSPPGSSLLAQRTPQGWMTIRGARANNLKGETIRFPLGVLTGVCGVSGSGKSTLMIDTLGRALAPKKQTTSVAFEPIDPGEHDAIEGAPGRVLLVDQSRAGVSSPAGFLGLVQPLQNLYADSSDARALGLTLEQLSSRCSACGGSGVITLDMAFLPDVHIPCETCRGTGYTGEAWDVRLKGVALPEVFGLTIDDVYGLFQGDERLSRPLQAAQEVGLGYLVLRQPGYALSGGEAQRLKIASEFCRVPRRQSKITKNQSPIANHQSAIYNSLYILDEPSIGQHLEDVARLTGVLHRLVDQGGSVIVVEHHPHLLAACDWLIELGPGGGPDGGRVVAEGTPGSLAAGNTPIAPYIREILST